MQGRSLGTIAVVAFAGVALTTTGAVAGSLVTSKQIADHTILTQDLAQSTVRNIRTTYQRKITRSVADGANSGFNVACDAGDLAIGGGFRPDGPGVLGQGSYPYSPTAGNGWVQQVWNTSGDTRSVEFYVVCFNR